MGGEGVAMKEGEGGEGGASERRKGDEGKRKDRGGVVRVVWDAEERPPVEDGR